ncbi:MAG: TlpA disulfide reductase family protein [Bacteroidota bacterium]
MIKPILIVSTLLGILLFSCNDNSQNSTAKKSVRQSSFVDLQTDFKKWWIYHNQNITFDLDFVGKDQEGKQLTKKEFFTLTASGLYLIEKKSVIDGINQYQLVKTDHNIDKSINSTLKGIGNDALHNLKMEGKLFPQFSFRDVNGKAYSNEAIKGKTVIVKCWFIGCTACIKEFPELNALVAAHQDREDLLFLSLAQDDDADLIQFLKKKTFAYEVVGNQTGFMDDDLSIRKYPTHIVIGKDGVVERVFDTVKGIENFLGYQTENEELKESQLPPPAPVSKPL